MYQISSNVINITNLFQSPFISTPISDTSNIEFTVPVFINPPTTKPIPYTITISTGGYPIAKYTYIYTAVLQSFIGATISSTSYQVMDTMVSYTLTFTPTYNYKSVSILIPP
jgi:hypothetical protein